MEQTVAVQATQTQPGLRQLLGAKAGQISQTDAFAAIFQQMMGEGFDEAILQMLGQAQEDGERMGSQMAAEMLTMAPALQMQMLSLLQPQAETEGALPAGKIPAGLNMAKELAIFIQPDEQAQGDTNGKIFADGNSAEFYTVLQSAWKESAQQPVFGLQVQQEAVQEAKQMLAKKAGNPSQPVDIEQLQADVSAGKYFPADAVIQKQAGMLPDMTEIAGQLKNGVLEHVAQGENEFVVRLKPEGVGEIVVKLSENKESISLSIYTSSTQTAKMITNEVATLQNALRPLHVQVQEVVVTPDGQANGYAAQTAMTNHGQQFHGQQFLHQEQHSSSSGGQEEAGFQTMIEQLPLDDGLDTYI